MRISKMTSNKYSVMKLEKLFFGLMIVAIVSACTELTTNSTAEHTKPLVTDVVTAIKAAQKNDGEVCDANANWFPQSQTPATNDLGFKSSSNCVFHQWAWQKFLWLTQKVNGEPRFMSFASPESLLGIERKGMMPRTEKDNDAHAFDEFAQAGTDGVFVAHNGRAVYYSQYLNTTFVDFILNANLNDYTKVLAQIDKDPSINYPIDAKTQQGSTELKVSWMIVEAGDDVSDMFTTSAEIATLENVNGKIQVSNTQTQVVTLALVGFHIAGIVNGHPEMVWATFEHLENAPNMPTNLPLEDIVSNDNFTFYTANTTAADCNINYSASDLQVLDQASQKLSPITQVCRQYEYGNAAGVNTTNDKNIQLINQSVVAQIGADNIWRNYREVGAIWFNTLNALQPGLSLGDDKLLTGSLSLSNSTIETFTQVASTEDNCFRCHHTLEQYPPKLSMQMLPQANLNISHAFQNIFFGSQQQAANATPTLQGEEQ
jgi:hypothetical protein